MTIILFCGGKQSGKTTAATAVYAYKLTQAGAIPNARIDDSGKMSIVYDKVNNTGIYFDIDNKDPDFLKFKREYCDKYISHVGFADYLKNTCANLFGLDYQKITGTNEQKQELCGITWGSFLSLLSKKHVAKLKQIYGQKEHNEYMTNREFMEVFGTFVCREIKEDCHAQSAYNEIVSSSSEIVMSTDCRFENEFEIFERDPNVLKIRLKRDVFKSNALSERGLDDIDDSRFDLVIENQDMSMAQKNNIVIEFLIEVGVLSNKDIEVEV